MKILGISGKARHGKDTCANLIVEIAKEKGLNVGKWALAHPLKAAVYGEQQGKHSLDEIFDTKPPIVRELLQKRGTEGGRDRYGPKLWTLQSEAFMRIFRENLPLDGVVFTDIRFPNEVEFVRNGAIDTDVFIMHEFSRLMAAKGFGDYLEEDPQDVTTLANLLEAESVSILEAIEEASKLEKGMVLYISSNRPTLEGPAAKHPSETALDSMDKRLEFDGIINNNTDVTLEDLKTQLTPYVTKLFNL